MPAETDENAKKQKRCTPVFYAILVPAHLYFSRCASERERSERERSASEGRVKNLEKIAKIAKIAKNREIAVGSRVPLAAEAGRGPAAGRPEGGLGLPTPDPLKF